MNYIAFNDYRNYLAHYGIKGMKWGIRRYQNPDGTLTDAGRKRREKEDIKKKKRKEMIAFDKENILRSPYKTRKYYYELSEDDINKAFKNFERRKKLSDYSRNDYETGNKWMMSTKAYLVTLTTTAALLSSPGGKLIKRATKNLINPKKSWIKLF